MAVDEGELLDKDRDFRPISIDEDDLNALSKISPQLAPQDQDDMVIPLELGQNGAPLGAGAWWRGRRPVQLQDRGKDWNEGPTRSGVAAAVDVLMVG